MMRVRSASSVFRVLVAAGVCSALIGAGPPPAWAQDAEQWIITFAGGIGKPTGGAFSEEWGSGASVLLSVSRVLSPTFELGAEFGYNQFSPEQDQLLVPGLSPEAENDWEMWRLRFRARRMFASEDARIAPFVVAGAGVYPITITSEDSTGIFKITHTGTGLGIGAGVDYRAGLAVHFGLEGQYHYLRTDEAQVGYKAAPLIEVIFAIRWLPGGTATGG